MNDKPTSPFLGLDRALIRSTRPTEPDREVEEQPPAQVEPIRLPNRGKRASKPAPSPASQQARTHASTLAGEQDELVAALRRLVKVPGKEVVYVRLTAAEKQQLADIVYTYKRQGHKTSDTEISRIAVNYIMEDYKAHGRGSILAQVMEAMLA